MKTFTLKDRSEVEIRVAQELKNNQDFIYETNQSIQNLSNSLVAMSNLYEKLRASSESERKTLEISVQNLNEQVLSRLASFNYRLTDIESECIELHDELVDKLDDFVDEYMTRLEHNKASKTWWSYLDEINQKIKVKDDYFDTAVIELKRLASDQVDAVRKEIPFVPDIEPIKKEISNQFQAFKIDYEGISKELSLIKKAIAYNEKKFENIYTLIERLKVGTQ